MGVRVHSSDGGARHSGAGQRPRKFRAEIPLPGKNWASFGRKTPAAKGDRRRYRTYGRRITGVAAKAVKPGLSKRRAAADTAPVPGRISRVPSTPVPNRPANKRVVRPSAGMERTPEACARPDASRRVQLTVAAELPGLHISTPEAAPPRASMCVTRRAAPADAG